MKTPIPVNLNDLQATAKDDKRGLCRYKEVEVYWDDATNSYDYKYRGGRINADQAKDILNK